MKTTVQLGMLAILVEANDYKELVRQAWAIYRLNQAIHQEGLPMDEFMPYAESGADGNEYRGFVHVPTGKRIKLGLQKEGNGGEWFPRPKGSDHYKGLESWNDAGDTSRQLPAHEEKPKVGGKAKASRSSGDGASTPPPQAEPTMDEKVSGAKSFLDAAKDSTPENWMKAIGRTETKIGAWPVSYRDQIYEHINKLCLLRGEELMYEPAQADGDLPF